MKMIGLVFFELAAVLTINSAQAAQPDSVSAAACVAATNIQSEQIACVSPELEASSLELSQAYAHFMQYLKDKQTPGGGQNLYYANLVDSLKMSERSWIQFQTNQCEFEGNLTSRKNYVLVTEMLCTNRINKERIQYLKTSMAQLNFQ
jgi:uncharacterized protein YecT (DUF1311 family)